MPTPRCLAVAVLALALSACGSGAPEGDFRSVPVEARETAVDPGAAARLVNGFRLSRGRAPVGLDPTLSRIAAETARELARIDSLRSPLHTRDGLVRRLEAAGYVPLAAAENLGQGYPTLELAMAGWRNSPGHRRNLLNANVTEMGIGLALTDRGRYRSYWVLILAAPLPAAGDGA